MRSRAAPRHDGAVKLASIKIVAARHYPDIAGVGLHRKNSTFHERLLVKGQTIETPAFFTVLDRNENHVALPEGRRGFADRV